MDRTHSRLTHTRRHVLESLYRSSGEIENAGGAPHRNIFASLSLRENMFEPSNLDTHCSQRQQRASLWANGSR
jgi:hypothetical protein